jgi:hypothetical protein
MCTTLWLWIIQWAMVSSWYWLSCLVESNHMESQHEYTYIYIYIINICTHANHVHNLSQLDISGIVSSSQYIYISIERERGRERESQGNLQISWVITQVAKLDEGNIHRTALYLSKQISFCKPIHWPWMCSNPRSSTGLEGPMCIHARCVANCRFAQSLRSRWAACFQ